MKSFCCWWNHSKKLCHRKKCVSHKKTAVTGNHMCHSKKSVSQIKCLSHKKYVSQKFLSLIILHYPSLSFIIFNYLSLSLLCAWQAILLDYLQIICHYPSLSLISFIILSLSVIIFIKSYYLSLSFIMPYYRLLSLYYPCINHYYLLLPQILNFSSLEN